MAQLKDLLVTGTSRFLGDIYGNASSASKLITARMLTIGKTGKNFDGSNNISWDINDIGAYSLYDRGAAIIATEDNPKDLNTLSAGNYYVLNSENAQWISNTPFTTGYRLICQAGYGSGGYVSNHGYQIAFAMNGDIKFRSNNNGNWGDWLDYLLTTGGTINGSLTVKNNILIDNDQEIPHLAFSRKLDENGKGGVNYITVPTDGMLSINCEDLLSGANGASLVISKDYLRPGKTNEVDLGMSGKEWKNVYATTFNGALNGNASSATKLATARTINGTSFDGTGNITTAKWGTARNIYIASSDGTGAGEAVSVNGGANATLKLPATIKATLSGNASTATTATYALKMQTYKYNSTETYGTSYPLYAQWNQQGNIVLLKCDNYTVNTDTATKLATARTINGTSFDGTGNITTAKWGTERTLTIGNTGKSVNGSGNVSWNLAEIGAVPKIEGSTNGSYTVYRALGNIYKGGTAVSYYRIAIPQATPWGMFMMKLAVRESFNTGSAGEIIIYANHSSSAEWNTFYATCIGNLSTNIKVYGSDKKYLYIAGSFAWGGLSIELMTVGDSASTINLSNIVIDSVDSLPSTYQTAIMYYSLHSGNYTTHLDSRYLKLAGGTMTGAIITPGDDSAVIRPSKNNYDTIGSPDYYFYEMYSTNYYLGTGTADMSKGALKIKTINAPVSSDSTDYGAGSSGQVLKSNGSTVYWGTVSGGTSYTLPQATNNALGGVKIGYSENDKNYPVKLNTSGQMYVHVPWTSTSITDYCTLSTAQTITGAKTFKASPIITNSDTPKIMLIPNSTNSNNTYSNAYVEGGSSDVIKLWIDSNKNTSTSSRRGLELHGYQSKAKVSESLRLRRCDTTGKWLSDLLVYHQGNIVYSSTEPSSTERTTGMIWLKPI